MSSAIFIAVNAVRQGRDEKEEEDFREKLKKEGEERVRTLKWIKGGKDDE